MLIARVKGGEQPLLQLNCKVELPRFEDLKVMKMTKMMKITKMMTKMMKITKMMRRRKMMTKKKMMMKGGEQQLLQLNSRVNLPRLRSRFEAKSNQHSI